MLKIEATYHVTQTEAKNLVNTLNWCINQKEDPTCRKWQIGRMFITFKETEEGYSFRIEKNKTNSSSKPSKDITTGIIKLQAA